MGPQDLLCLPGSSDGKESACNARDPDLIPGSGRSPGEGNGYPLQYSLENEMAKHSSILAVRIPRKEAPGGLQSTGSQRVRHDWVTNPPVFLPGEFPGQSSLEATVHSHKESNTTEWPTQDLGGGSSSYRKGSYFERSVMVRKSLDFCLGSLTCKLWDFKQIVWHFCRNNTNK